MQPDFWHELWDNDFIPFNQQRPNPLLVAHWPALDLAADATVFVPLCGKAVDMAWLADRGHSIVGSELSERAVRDFFSERDLAATTTASSQSQLFESGPYHLHCGDLFELTPSDLAATSAVYDRASLVALPPAMRARYAAHLTSIVPETAVIFVISFEYDQSEMAGPPFSVTRAEIEELYGSDFDIRHVAAEDTPADSERLTRMGLSALAETVSVLARTQL